MVGIMNAIAEDAKTVAHGGVSGLKTVAWAIVGVVVVLAVIAGGMYLYTKGKASIKQATGKAGTSTGTGTNVLDAAKASIDQMGF